MYINKDLDKYKSMIQAMASLSRLSSESSVPYLGYREVENIYCRAFNAKNVSRVDCSVDAVYRGIGIGIKTFLEGNKKTLQKVAEFNRDSDLFREKGPEEIVRIVSKLRNERIEFTKRLYGINVLKYHCVIRNEGVIRVFETPMELINIDKIKNIKMNKQNTITFSDNLNEYSINLSKSTLYKRFITPKELLLEFNIKIIEDPYEAITNMFKVNNRFLPIVKEKEYVFLPLFSEKGSRNVPKRSGLNQWNANGRARDYNEVYISIPSWIHGKFSNFFPQRDIIFELVLPDGKELSAKVCQDGRKAIMTNPNKDLGVWILRQVMNLKEGEILTYEKLEELGIDSVVIYKESISRYTIDFAEIGSYDKFKDEFYI